MIFFHGSPEKLDTIKPQKANGDNDFQSQEAVYLTRDFNEAALYAIGRSLRGRAEFKLIPGKLIIVGDHKPYEGYIYEVNLDLENVIGDGKDYYEFVHFEEISNFVVHKISPEKYKEKVFYVNTYEELLDLIKNRNNDPV